MGNFSLVLGSTLLALPFFIILFAMISFAVNISLTSVTIWLGVIATAIYSLWATCYYYQQDWQRVFTKLCICAVVLFVSFMYLSGLFYDISYDGQVYHQEAINQLVHHWNPLQHYLTKDQSHSAMLLNHYAKGPWLYEAALYCATGQIEQSKVFNFLLIIASFLLTLSTLRRCGRFSKAQSVLFSLVMALNPISIYQGLSFYIDGQLASLLLCMVALAYRLVTQYDKVILWSWLMMIGLTVNIKFTGIVYVVVGCGLVGLWFLKDKQFDKVVIKTSIVGLVLGICVMGYNPYVTNMVYYGHPFYPLYGGKNQTMDIMTSNSPTGFMQMSSWEKLYVATFSSSANGFDGEGPTLKIPFSIRPQELKPFIYGADIRIGGFGPWFGGIVVMTGMTLAVMGMYRKKEQLYGIGLALSILCSVLINPEAWWARYVPQLWLVPIVIAAVALSDGARKIQYWGALLLGAIIMNIGLISYPYLLGNYYCTQDLGRQLEVIAQQQAVVVVDFGDFNSNYGKFADWGIQYVDGAHDAADINIQDIRYKYLTAVAHKRLLADIFVEERKDKCGE